jgi:hypothetical protein
MHLSYKANFWAIKSNFTTMQYIVSMPLEMDS